MDKNSYLEHLKEDENAIEILYEDNRRLFKKIKQQEKVIKMLSAKAELIDPYRQLVTSRSVQDEAYKEFFEKVVDLKNMKIKNYKGLMHQLDERIKKTKERLDG